MTKKTQPVFKMFNPSRIFRLADLIVTVNFYNYLSS